MRSSIFGICLFLLSISIAYAQSDTSEVCIEGHVKIGTSNGAFLNSHPTLNVFGDHSANNFILRLEQGGDGINKGLFFGSPESATSGRMFMDQNLYSLGRANTANNYKMINLHVNGNVGINEEHPKADLHVRRDVQIGSSNGIFFNGHPTLNLFGDNIPENYVLRMEQGAEGSGKGLFLGSPGSTSSSRMFLENNIFSIGRANNQANTKMLNFHTNGNIGINEPFPKSKLHIKEGDIYLEDINSGIIVRSSNGTCWRLEVLNTGVLEPVAVPCPN